jgi:hypothetical protein
VGEAEYYEILDDAMSDALEVYERICRHNIERPRATRPN